MFSDSSVSSIIVFLLLCTKLGLAKNPHNFVGPLFVSHVSRAVHCLDEISCQTVSTEIFHGALCNRGKGNVNFGL